MVKERRDEQFDILEVNPNGNRPLLIPIPRLKPVTPEEIERRRRLFEEVSSTRAQMDPVSLDDLLDDGDPGDRASNG